MNRQTALTKQALERWNMLSSSEQQELLKELQTKPAGTAAIELGEPYLSWEDGLPTGRHHCKARIVSIIFGMDVTQHKKRYLFASDIPK